ncbi:GNAT family N-acetyltransferase [Salinilacustrithrix flava]|uniref:GNAT family N-acetyltransferase n=1 Tax=Salinilacustrithrix flava TaxID=2957203 RepID=UPI003D7C26EC
MATRPHTYLRKPSVADAEEFVARVAESEHLEPWAFPPADVGAFRQWLTRGERHEIEQFLVCSREDDGIAGFVNLNGIQRGAVQRATAGWAALSPYVGRGHLTDGVSMAIEVAFTQMRLHRFEADIQPGNERSRALARRCGLRLEGYSPRLVLVDGDWRDHERWAVNAEDWRAARRS